MAPVKEKKPNQNLPEKNIPFINQFKNFLENKPIELKNEEEFKIEDEDVVPEETDQRMYLFGTDAESIIIEYNLTKTKPEPFLFNPPSN